MFKYLMILSFVLSFNIMAAPQVGSPLPHVILKGDDGGKVLGGEWDSQAEIGNRSVSIMFYVDPDESDTNDSLSKALKEKNFDKTKISSFGFVNMAATWLPNVVISQILAGKQKKYPDTTMVRDYKRKLVKEWDFADDSSVVAIFNKSKQLIYYKAGAHTSEEITQVLDLISTEINK